MKIQKNVDLSSLNTLQLKSTAEQLVELRTIDDVQNLIADKNLNSLNWHILGGGSNLVLPSTISGLVIRPMNQGQKLVKEDSEAWYVQSEAGTVWDDLVRWTLSQGYWGLENLSLIPGTVGAAPIQNIGAYGVEVKDSIHEVHAIEIATGKSVTFNNSDCHFSYRESFFKQEGAGKYLIWQVTFRLPKKNVIHLEYGDIKKEVERLGHGPDPRFIAEAVVNIRQSKLPDPKVIGNAGSFFKNPIVSKEQREQLLAKHPDLVSYAYQDGFKLAAGWLIDRAGWKGKNLGPVGMYAKQALVLVNHGGGNAQDVKTLASNVAADVLAQFGVTIEPEPIHW